MVYFSITGVPETSCSALLTVVSLALLVRR